MLRALQHNEFNKKKKNLESQPLDQLSSSKWIKNQQQEFKASYNFEDMLLEDVFNLTRNEPSPRFVFNGIHMKTRPENL